MSKVIIHKINGSLKDAIGDIFDDLIPSEKSPQGRDVYIKVNAVDARPGCHISPEVVFEVVHYFKRRGARRVFAMENSTQGNLTRIVFNATGILKAVKAAGGVPLCMDEGPDVTLPFAKAESSPADSQGYEQLRFCTSRIVYRELILRRDEVVYVNLPKLKTHSMTAVSLGIKNQWGFIRHRDRIADHNFNLHSKLAALALLFRPDYTLIDGQEAIIHGHYPPRMIKERCAIPLDVIIGGDDILATDVVGARILGYSRDEVEHLALAKEIGVGEGDMDKVHIDGDLSPYKKRYPFELMDLFPDDVNFIRGKERCCPEGCLGNTRSVLQVFFLDHAGRGGFDIIVGKGLDEELIRSINGPAMVVGGCARDEVRRYLGDGVKERGWYLADGCNNLPHIIRILMTLMRVNPMDLVPLPPHKAMTLMAIARLKGTNSAIPPLNAPLFK